jgi:hypothetical protein
VRSVSESAVRLARLAAGLRALGVERGDRALRPAGPRACSAAGFRPPGRSSRVPGRSPGPSHQSVPADRDRPPALAHIGHPAPPTMAPGSAQRAMERLARPVTG